MNLDLLIAELVAGKTAALARAISVVENTRPGFERLLGEVHRSLGRARRIGVTGPPGAGKSTLVERLVAQYRSAGLKVAVVAVDPTSPFTGGALLGDRIRMESIALDQGVYIRSMASRGSLGGLATTTREVCDLLDAAGFDRILVETVGVGQSELDVGRMADSTVLVLVPESGDGIQAMKSGLLEIADIIAINKADRGGADRMEHDLRTAFELGLRSRKEIPILITEAVRGKGIPELMAAVDALVASRRASGAFQERRRRNMEDRIKEIAEFLIRRNLWSASGAEGKVAAAAESVLSRRQSPYQGAQALVKEVLR